jgi:hypothetical protein
MEIKKNADIHQMGLFATTCYKKNEIVFRLNGKIMNYPTRESIHIGENLHIIDEFGSFMNHSFQPSCRIENRNVIANIDINVGDELNFDYNESEVSMASPFYIDGRFVGGKDNNLSK